MSVSSSDVGIGIVTALPVEYAAVREVLDEQRQFDTPADRSHYLLGTMPGSSGSRHHVALTMLVLDGTRSAAAATVSLLSTFTDIRCVVMVGIAGGVPDLSNPRRHVRLGDIVVATDGLVDYGHVRSVNGQQLLRRAIEGPSAELLRADRLLQAGEMSGERPWERRLAAGGSSLAAAFARPPERTDVLMVDGVVARHPDDASEGRRRGFPRVHRGLVGSADQLVRDTGLRDRLAREHGIRAVEMEGAGIASGAAHRSVGWFMVRGVVDYCDDITKNDLWHPYGSLAAAVYTRALLAQTMPALGAQALPARRGSSVVDGMAVTARLVEPLPRPRNALEVILEALLGVVEVLDHAGRQELVSALPRNIQGAVRTNPRARLHTLAIIRACQSFHGGRQALLDALRLVVPDGSRELDVASTAVELYWDRLDS